MRKMILVLGTMFLMLSLAVIPASTADEKGAVKADGGKSAQEKAANPARCWKRMKIDEGKRNTLTIDETGKVLVPQEGPVCVAFEEVLNTICEPPEKLQYNWTLPEGEKRFQKLKWETGDWREYWDMIGDIFVNFIFPTGEREERWELMKDSERKDFEEGKSSLSITTVDINGMQEAIARIDCLSISCNKKRMYGVMDTEDKRINWRYRNSFFAVHASTHGSEIMMYKRQVFAFRMEDVHEPMTAFPTQEVILYAPFSDSVPIECRFKYLKGGTKQ